MEWNDGTTGRQQGDDNTRDNESGDNDTGDNDTGDNGTRDNEPRDNEPRDETRVRGSEDHDARPPTLACKHAQSGYS